MIYLLVEIQTDICDCSGMFYNYIRANKLNVKFLNYCFHSYPCISTKAEYNEEKSYSGQVACARFLYNDRNIVTVGGTDAGLMLWELTEE